MRKHTVWDTLGKVQAKIDVCVKLAKDSPEDHPITWLRAAIKSWVDIANEYNLGEPDTRGVFDVKKSS